MWTAHVAEPTRQGRSGFGDTRDLPQRYRGGVRFATARRAELAAQASCAPGEVGRVCPVGEKTDPIGVQQTEMRSRVRIRRYGAATEAALHRECFTRSLIRESISQGPDFVLRLHRGPGSFSPPGKRCFFGKGLK